VSRAYRDGALRKVRQARRLHDAALDHYAVADELMAEVGRLVDEVKELEAGRPRVQAEKAVTRTESGPAASAAGLSGAEATSEL
jgi:hypothetical protein